MLKCQFHIHTAGDPRDNISYSPKELIDRAAKLKYDVLAITCHRKVVFTKNLQNYAKKKGIILLPGAELSINKKDVLAINADESIEEAKTFEDLRQYKNSHPDCIIIAPHPFFPHSVCLKNRLIENIDLFDAIEYSYFYTKSKNYNKKTVKVAEKFNKPLIGNSDCHVLKYLDVTHTLVDSPKNISSIIKALKNGKTKIVSSPITYRSMFSISTEILFRNTRKFISSLGHKTGRSQPSQIENPPLGFGVNRALNNQPNQFIGI